MNYFKKILDVICFVFGPVLFIISIFSFGYRGLSGGGLYYPSDSIFGIGLGTTLICIGFLRIYWRKNKNTNK